MYINCIRIVYTLDQDLHGRDSIYHVHDALETVTDGFRTKPISDEEVLLRT